MNHKTIHILKICDQQLPVGMHWRSEKGSKDFPLMLPNHVVQSYLKIPEEIGRVACQLL